MCPVSPALLCLSPPLLSLSASPSRSPVPRLLCCVDFSGGPGVGCQHLSEMLQFLCYIPIGCIIYICILHIRSSGFVVVFSLSLSLLSLSCLSPSLPFTRPTLSRMVPPCKLGSAQGFFLLKGSFAFHCANLAF